MTEDLKKMQLYIFLKLQNSFSQENITIEVNDKGFLIQEIKFIFVYYWSLNFKFLIKNVGMIKDLKKQTCMRKINNKKMYLITKKNIFFKNLK